MAAEESQGKGSRLEHTDASRPVAPVDATPQEICSNVPGRQNLPQAAIGHTANNESTESWIACSVIDDEVDDEPDAPEIACRVIDEAGVSVTNSSNVTCRVIEE